MDYASISEVYDTNTLQQRENKYNSIIENLTKTNQRERQYGSRNISIPDPIQTGNNYMDYENVSASLGKKRSKFTTYKNVENFSNNLEEDKLLKGIEDKIDREYNSPNSKKEYITLKDNEDTDCLKFLDHISKCEKCREFIIKKFKLTEATPEQKNREYMLDIAIYILTGVFVLFLLDSFMNLGKYIRK